MTVVAPVTGLVAAVVPGGGGHRRWGTVRRRSPSPGSSLAIVAVALIGGIAGMFSRHGAKPAVDAGTVALALGVGLRIRFAVRVLDRFRRRHRPVAPAVRPVHRPAGARLVAYSSCSVAATAADRRELVVPAVVVGALIAGSNVALPDLDAAGLLSVVAVVVAMYPASTIVLASVIDGERATRAQLAGMALAVAALVLSPSGADQRPGSECVRNASATPPHRRRRTAPR